MVDAHLKGGAGDRIFIEVGSMQGTHLVFAGGAVRRNWENIDPGLLRDVADHGLVQMGYSRHGTPNYRIGSEGLQFRRSLLQRQASTIMEVETEARRLVEGEAFARKHR